MMYNYGWKRTPSGDRAKVGEGAMVKVRCAIPDCRKEQEAERMFWCPKCEAWYCKDHTTVGFWDNIRRCPKKHEIPKGQE